MMKKKIELRIKNENIYSENFIKKYFYIISKDNQANKVKKKKSEGVKKIS